LLPAPTLHPATAGCDNQDLAQRMGVLGGSSARFKGDTRAKDMRLGGRIEQGVNTHCASNILGSAFSGRL